MGYFYMCRRRESHNLRYAIARLRFGNPSVSILPPVCVLAQADHEKTLSIAKTIRRLADVFAMPRAVALRPCKVRFTHFSPDPFPRSSLSSVRTVKKKIAMQIIAMAFSCICAGGETRTLTPEDTRF